MCPVVAVAVLVGLVALAVVVGLYRYVWWRLVGLQLSGHTHGGQLWPGSLVAELANPTVGGLKRYGDTQLYVTRGAGAWGPPVRVGAPSDVTVVELAVTRA